MRPADRQKMKRLNELMQREADDDALTDADRYELESLKEWRARHRADAPGRLHTTYTPPDGGSAIDLDEAHRPKDRGRFTGD